MSPSDLAQIANPGIGRLRPYEPGKPIEELERELGISDIVKLASNENPLGASTAVEAALQAATADLARYPDGSGYRLKTMLGSELDVPMGQITLGNGSNELFQMLAGVFLRPGLNAVCSAHAFAMYPKLTRAAGADLREVPALGAQEDQAYGHDLAAFPAHVDDRTRLVFIANPNNPTGTWVDPRAIEDFLQQLPPQVLVVLDEAYCEYQDPGQRPDSLGLLRQYPNLVITRTFSKVFGLAALRIGYALSHPDVAELLNRVRQPFNNNQLALVAAEAAWHDRAHVAASIEINADGMAFYHEQLPRLGLNVLPSQANFVCVDCGRDAQPIFEALLHRGVIVRSLSAYNLPQHLRITIGTPEDNERCLEALEAVL